MFDIFTGNNILLLVIATLWILPWKGYALWLSVKRNQKKWFIALLILNTFAILEIFYIFFVVKKTPRSIIQTIKNIFRKTIE